MFQKILLPVEASGIKDKVADKIIRLSKANNATVTVLHSYSVTDSHISFNTEKENAITDIFKREAIYLLNLIKTRLEKGGLRITTMLVKGEPGRAITEIAEDYNFDLIVMPNRRGIRRFFSFSVSKYVSRHASVPVLILPNQ